MTSLTEAERRVQERLESSWGRCITTSNEKLASSKSELHRLIHKLDNADSDTTTVSCGWKDIVDRCRSHPKEVSMVDGRGRTCLSLACARNPPLAVVETMLAASPTSRWRFRPHHELRDKTGWTAMTIAITNNASLEVIRLLATQQDLVNTPDHYGNTPLHLACQYKVMVEILLKAGGDAGRENNNGKTPLHVAIENKASLKVVRMLSEACPDAVINASCGRTPLFYAISNIALQTSRILVRTNPRVTHVRNEMGRLPLYYALTSKVRDSKLVELLCTSEEAVLDSDSIQRNSLHLALERNVNPCIVETLLNKAPQAACAFGNSAVETCYRSHLRAQRHSNGQEEKEWTVLCMVLQAYNHDSPQNSLLHSALVTNAPVSVIRRILYESPQDAKRPNVRGCYPLAIACKMNVPVKEKDAIIHLILNAGGADVLVDRRQQSVLAVLAEHGGVSSNTIDRIICADPRALKALDQRHNMYPFMIAALRKKEEDETIQVGAIFALLLAAPSLIQSCV